MPKTYVKKVSSFPVRYGLFQREGLIFTFSTVTYKYFFKSLSINQERYDVSDIIEKQPDFVSYLKKMEKEILLGEMFGYLAKKETSPAKLEQWLSYRIPKAETRKEWLLLAKSKKFLDVERYILWVSERKKIQGQSWRKTSMLLKLELAPYHFLLSPGEEMEELITRAAYDDLETLNKYFKPPLGLKKNPGKLKKYLASRGFDFSVIKEYLRSLEEV